MISLDGKKVLLTGASGFLGQHFLKFLPNTGAETVAISRKSPPVRFSNEEKSAERVHWVMADLGKSGDLDKAVDSNYNIDIVIHCAALDGNADFKKNHTAEIVRVNTQLTTNVMEFSRTRGIHDVVLVSSAEIYATDATNPVREEDDFATKFPAHSNGYVLSKVIMEIMGLVYEKQYGMRIYVPRLTNLYGSGEMMSEERLRVIPSMVTKVLAGSDVLIWGNGKQTRSFIHVEDAVRCIVLMVRHGKTGALNIATNESVSVAELARYVFKIADIPERITYLETMPTGPGNRILDVGKLYSILDFKPKEIRSGLAETIEWYQRSKSDKS